MAVTSLTLAVAAPSAGAARDTRIVMGSAAADGAWPSIAKIEARTDDAIYHCAGTVVAPRWIITAAHCTFDNNDIPFEARQFSVITGRLNRKNEAAGQQLVVDDVRRHPSFDAATHRFDVALLHLSSATSAPPMEIASPTGEYSAPDKVPNVAGWGTTATAAPGSEALLETYLEPHDAVTCSRVLGALFDPATMVCAGQPGRSTCQGDSGGPLIKFAEGEGGPQPVLYGLTSFGPSECGSGPNVFARVAAFERFLAAMFASPPTDAEPEPASSPPAPAPPPPPRPTPPSDLTTSSDATAPRLSNLRFPATVNLRGGFPTRPVVIRLRSNTAATLEIDLLRRAGARLLALRGHVRVSVAPGDNRIGLPRRTWSLSAGSYVLRIVSADAAGNSRTWTAPVRVRRDPGRSTGPRSLQKR